MPVCRGEVGQEGAFGAWRDLGVMPDSHGAVSLIFTRLACADVGLEGTMGSWREARAELQGGRGKRMILTRGSSVPMGLQPCGTPTPRETLEPLTHPQL
jgi:hypothetical protein